ncbi:MAG: NADH-quinone oxidoreductase subunit N [Actinobacteria bacterium]|nr:NADH-quinone oxidoreductase subunit N [Actinomycetota bacterium]
MVTAQTFVGLIPEIVAFLFSMLVLMVGVFSPRAPGLTTGLAAFGTLATFVATVVLLATRFEGSFFGEAYVVDDFALYFKLIVTLSAFFAVLAAARWSRRTGDAPEYLTLILSVAVGAMLLVSMRDLFGVFVAIELATIPSYALVAFDRSRRESAEGGMKYLLTGMIASSILLYGIVFWTPDAYQGAPTSAAAFLSVAPKAATFAVLLRIFLEGMPGAAPSWTAVAAVLSIVTMFVGNLFALRQSNVRRMLAYSSVAHSGYILAAFAALQGGGAERAVQAVLIYSAAYALMNMGAFFVIDLVGEEAKSYNGLFRTRPGVALSMAVFMAALVGIPPLSGFWGKAWIILAGAQSGSILTYVAVGALVVNSVLSVPYYFGILRNMAFEESVKDAEELKGAGALKFSVYALAIATTLFLFFIGPLASLTQKSGLL